MQWSTLVVRRRLVATVAVWRRKRGVSLPSPAPTPGGVRAVPETKREWPVLPWGAFPPFEGFDPAPVSTILSVPAKGECGRLRLVGRRP